MLWIADEEKGLICDGRALCPAPVSLCACGDTVICAQSAEGRVFARDTRHMLARYPLPPDPRRLCALPGALYCLSCEADSLSLLCPQSGRLRLCAQAGCYPRDLTISPCGRLLAVAGGAAGAMFVFKSDDLSIVQKINLPGIVYAAAFQGTALLALCAVEESDVSSSLCRVSVRGVVSELARMSGLPGALIALPDGSIMAGTLGQLVRMRPDGRILQRLQAALPARLRLKSDCVLCADPLAGTITAIPLSTEKPATLYHGGSPVDIL